MPSGVFRCWMEIITNIDYKALYEEQKRTNEILHMEVMKMQLYVRKLSQIVFGAKSERFIPHPAQLALDMNTEAPAPACALADAQKVAYTRAGNKPKKQRVLSELSRYLDALPQVYETLEPEAVPPGAIKIGEDRMRTLEVDPGKLFVKVTIIPRYKLPAEDDTITTIIAAAAPERPLPWCMAGASVLAQILVDKYCDHLPIFRQIKRFERGGVYLPYNTILDWAGKTIDLMEVLYEALKKEILATNYIHVDETGLKVLCSKENRKSRNIHDGFLCCYHSSIKGMVFFDYQHGRSEKCTEGILRSFRGIIILLIALPNCCRTTGNPSLHRSILRIYRDVSGICFSDLISITFAWDASSFLRARCWSALIPERSLRASSSSLSTEINSWISIS